MLFVDLQKQLRDFALDIQFEIEPQILVLFGASGAGKTTTLNCLAGLVTPERSEIKLDGRDLARVPTRLRRIGYVFQNYALFPHLTVRENIAFGVRDADATPRVADATPRVNEMLALTHLTELAARYPSQLSGGEQQRVALARALAIQPDLLLLDEPFSALDAPTRMQLRHELRDLQRQFNVPTIFVTHDLGEAYFLADQLAVMDAGSILQIGAPGEILRRPRNLRVARAVGVKNILPGVVQARTSETTRVRVGDIVLDAPPFSFEPGDGVFLCLRAERVTLVRPERAGSSSRENQVQGELVREMSDGMNVTLYFRAAGARLVQEQDYDLQIELPVYIYERLNLGTERAWTVVLRKNAMHLIGG